MANHPSHNKSSVGQRIIVIGPTGSGKTTLAGRLSAHLGLPHVEIDAIHWGPGWTPLPVDVFRRRVTEALQGDRWVADGNYSKVRDVVWSRADTVIWLDYPLALTLWRLFRRTMRRLIRQEPLWNENRETFRNHFLSRDSLFLWAVTSHRRHRREFQEMLESAEFGHLATLRFASPKATKDCLDTLGALDKPDTP